MRPNTAASEVTANKESPSLRERPDSMLNLRSQVSRSELVVMESLVEIARKLLGTSGPLSCEDR